MEGCKEFVGPWENGEEGRSTILCNMEFQYGEGIKKLVPQI